MPNVLPLTFCLLAGLLGMLSLATQAETLKVMVPPIEKSAATHVKYFKLLLELALRKTEKTDGPFEITEYPHFLSTTRAIAELHYNKSLTVIWTTPNRLNTGDLQVIPISLLKELNSYRLLLIRKEDQHLFDGINSLDELRKRTAGMGSQWQDASIMRNNDFNVVTSANYDSLFLMLKAKRFDFFPRGLYEVWNEAAQNPELAIEKHLMLYYDLPFYYFVNKSNGLLADRIARGLKLAQADGSFDRLFLSIPGFARALEEQQNTQRTLFHLQNN
jgi:hypothetical protein